MNGRLRFSSRTTAVIALVWLIGGLWLYFVHLGKRGLFHAGLWLLGDSVRRIGIPPGCGGRILDVGALLLLLASAWCVGLAMLRALRWIEKLDTLNHLLAIALGLGLWAWFVLIAGMLGAIAPGLYALPAFLSLLLIVWHKPWLTKSWSVFRQRAREKLRPFEVFLIACLVLGAVLHIIPAFAPEIEYDTLEYHLGALKEYQKAGRIHFLPHNFYASMPSLTEMLYLWGITLRSSTVAHLIHASFAGLTAIGLIAFGTRLGGRQLGLTAATLYYLLPFVTVLAETARIDLATTFFAFLAGAALHRHLFDADKHALRLAALAGGLAMATKYTAGPVVFLALILVLLIHRKQSSILHPRSSILFLVLAVLPVLPWLIKNAIFTGNPVYPLANGIFQSPFWDDVCGARFHKHHAPSFGTFAAWASLVVSPWSQSVRESFSSPILLLFAPMFLLVGKAESRWKFCAWYALLIYACWWAFTFRPWRFLFPAMPWFALLGAMAAVTLDKERTIGLLTRAALAILLVFNLNYSFIINAVDINNADQFPPETSKLAVFFGRVSPSEYLGRIYFTIGWMAKNLPPDATVLYVGEARIYYTPHRVLANTVYDRSIVGEMVARSKTTDDVLREMRAQGVTHIYINKDELDRVGRNYKYLQDMNWPLFNQFLESHTRVFFRNNAHTVYELLPGKTAAANTP
jgi:hypothetical protein